MRPLAIIIMDGLGISRQTEANAVAKARKPNLQRFWSFREITNMIYDF